MKLALLIWAGLLVYLFTRRRSFPVEMIAPTTVAFALPSARQ